MTNISAIRQWAAASPNVVKDWISESNSINQDLREQSKALRARARDLEQNNDYAYRYLQLLENGILGEYGINLQMRARTSRGRLDQRLNSLIEREFRSWHRAQRCTIDGRLNWYEVQKVVVRSVARDGEVLIRLFRDDGLRIMIYDASWLDNELNQDPDPRNGIGMISQGIEMDRFGKPIAYWLTKGEPAKSGTTLFGLSADRQEYERVPAEDIIHIYKSERPNQIRGATWMASVMVHLLMLNRYEKAEMLAAEFAAKKVGYYKTPTGDWLENDEDAKGYGLPTAINGLGMTELPEGVEMHLLDPTHPVSAYGEFVKTALKGIATGLGVTYHSLSGDLTEVNFSSIRSGTIEERDRFRAQQQWFISKLQRPIFEAWLAANLTRLGLPETDFNRLSEAHFQTRGYTWVDPVKDMQAKQMEYQMGVCSLQDIASSLGRDLEEIFEQRAKESEMASAYGVSIENINTEFMEPSEDEQNLD